MNDSTLTQTKSKSNLSSRLKTAGIALPILFFMLYFKFIVIYISHSEFHNIQTKILTKLFNEYYAEVTWKTLMSSPLPTLIFIISPILNYFFTNFEIFAFSIPIVFLIIYRMNKFILIHRVLNSNDSCFESLNTSKIDNTNLKSERVPNPIKSLILKENPELLKLAEKEENEKGKTQLGYLKKLKFILSENMFPNLIKDKILNEKNERENNKNLSNQFISSQMFMSCLVIFMLDLIFYIVYAFPLTLGISLHGKSNNGFVSFLMMIVVAYQCDNGALFAGKLFGRNPFGDPVTPNKTWEGIYGAVIFGFLSSYLLKYLVNYFYDFIILNNFSFFAFTCISIFTAIFGDFLESFLKRCGDVKDSGNILPGHGGILDRIDSLTLGIPIVYYFMS